MQIKIEDTKKEIKDHGEYTFPVDVSIEHIEAYDQGNFLWHWHPEIELTLLLSGKVEYRVNDKVYYLQEGQGLFGNSNTLHAGAQIDHIQCTYLSITFHPRFIYGYEGSVLQEKYVDPIISNGGWDSVALGKEVEWQKEVIEKMCEIYELSKQKSDGYEMQVHMLLSDIWFRIYKYFHSLPQGKKDISKKMQRLHEMIRYLQMHYTEEVTLDEISTHINLSKNECCRFFKKYMNVTIMEYLIILRIQNSLPLLEQGETVTRAANLVGFSSPAHFSQLFKRHMNMSPKEYQKSQIRKATSIEKSRIMC